MSTNILYHTNGIYNSRLVYHNNQSNQYKIKICKILKDFGYNKDTDLKTKLILPQNQISINFKKFKIKNIPPINSYIHIKIKEIIKEINNKNKKIYIITSIEKIIPTQNQLSNNIKNIDLAYKQGLNNKRLTYNKKNKKIIESYNKGLIKYSFNLGLKKKKLNTLIINEKIIESYKKGTEMSGKKIENKINIKNKNKNNIYSNMFSLLNNSDSDSDSD